MSSKQDKAEKERQKQIQDRCQVILSELLRNEDNKYCVDCDTKGPRWSSWNLGIFLCIRCAGIHRNLGVHISRVKSVNLDSWTPEQIAHLQQMGNSRARAVYEANLPDNFRRPQTDSSLEAFVRAKYEVKKYIAKEWVPLPPPKPAFQIDQLDEKKKSKDKKSSNKIKGVEKSVSSVSKVRISGGSTDSITPPPSRSTESKPAPQIQKASSAAFDLLGLDDPATSPQNEDSFGSFISASSQPQTQVNEIFSLSSTPPQANAAQVTRTSEEENFFNQTSAEEATKKQQITKESILSLYSQGTSAQPQQYSQNGVFMGQQQPVFTQGLPNVNYNIPASNSGGQISNLGLLMQTPQAIPQPSNQQSIAATNPFFAIPANIDTNSTNIMQSAALGQLQQQMASMALNNQAGYGVMNGAVGIPIVPPVGSAPEWSTQPPGRTLSTNLWQ